jgi:hypothetical protein
MATRDPPIEVKRKLRSEVGFACPLCGSPYLTWHHFDPPWNEGRVHNSDGMIALCLQHHKEADIGTYTNEQLRQLKAKSPPKNVRGAFNWRREHTIFVCGGNYFFNCEVALQIGSRPLIWFTKDDAGHDLLNIDLYRQDQSIAFSMRNNEWALYPEMDDVECPPSGRSLRLRHPSGRISLEICFDTLENAEERVDPRAQSFLLNDVQDRKGILVGTITGQLPRPIPISLRSDLIDVGGAVFSGCANKFCKVGIQL